jgi:drug/metabolite transporter (DMT)-like permease
MLIGVTVFLWSTIEVTTKLIHSQLPPLTIAFLRFVLGGVFLIPVVIINWKKVDRGNVNVKDWIVLILLSFVGITGTFSLYHVALYWIDASSVATLVSTVPLFSAPLSVLILKERIGGIGIAGLLMGGAGILLIYLSEEFSIESLIAVSIMCVAVACFSIYAVLMKPLNRKMDPRITTSLSLLIGGLMMVPVLLFDGAPLFRPVPPLYLVYLLFLSFFAVGLAYLFYFMGIDRVDISRGNTLMYLKPMLATVIALVVLTEVPTILRIVGIVTITISVYVVIREKKLLKDVNRMLRRQKVE